MTVTDLDARQIARALQAACRQEQTLVLTWLVAAEVQSLKGFITEVDDNCIQTRVPANQKTDTLPEPQTNAEAEFMIDGGRHTFHCHGMSLEHQDSALLISIALPESMQVAERRRSRRRALRPGCQITLMPVNHDWHEAVSGPLLNLSTHGLAMKLQGEMPLWITVGRKAWIHFSPALGIPDMDLFAQIASCTEGADECQLLGMEFVEDSAFAAVLPSLKLAVRG
jgi:c-di-GMP-binding flagellar brake protein YcgR